MLSPRSTKVVSAIDSEPRSPTAWASILTNKLSFFSGTLEGPDFSYSGGSMLSENQVQFGTNASSWTSKSKTPQTIGWSCQCICFVSWFQVLDLVSNMQRITSAFNFTLVSWPVFSPRQWRCMGQPQWLAMVAVVLGWQQ